MLHERNFQVAKQLQYPVEGLISSKIFSNPTFSTYTDNIGNSQNEFKNNISTLEGYNYIGDSGLTTRRVMSCSRKFKSQPQLSNRKR